MKTWRALTRGGRPGDPCRIVAALGFAPSFFIAFLAGPGCTDKACLEWSSDSASCPSREEALKRFGGQSCVADIKAVESDAEFNDAACCYEVTKRAAGDRSCETAGAGPSGGPDNPSGAGPCGGCAAFQAGQVSELCAPSVSLWNELVACLCSGPCAAACDDGSCSTSFDTPECQACVADKENGCGNQVAACSNDL